MYIEEIKKKQGSKIYNTILIRESYRDNGKVRHRTVANISKLPAEHIRQLKASLKGEKGNFKVSDLGVGRSYEYGGSFVLRELAKDIGLDKAIFSRTTQWRENILAMISGRILHQGSKLNLVNTYMDTALWEIAGHKFGARPDVEKDCYNPMDELLKRKDIIERKLAEKHLKNGTILLYDITNTWLEGEYKDSDIVRYGMGKGGKRGYKQVSIGLLTNAEGCPVGIETFKGNTSDQTTVLDQIKKISEKYGIKEAVFVGDRGMLTQKRINEIDSDYFKTITALTHTELSSIIKKENIQVDLFDEMNITEIIDSKNSELRYMLCKNENEKVKEGNTREALIKKVEVLLSKKAAVKKKRDKRKTCASIGRIFEKTKIEKFFLWDVDDNGKLSWNRKEKKIEEEKLLDGCYVIKTNVSDIMNKESVVEAYRGLQKVEQAFKNMKTVLLELRPIHHKSDDRIIAHIFIVMLAYYLQWHFMQRVASLFANDGEGDKRRWSFDIIIKRLKSITRVEQLIKNIVVKTNISTPDTEQNEILRLLNINL
jgi:transposase